MSVPALMIGLGGTGGVCLSFARARLTEQLEAAGWAEAMPEHLWQFLHIDLRVTSDIEERLRRAERGSTLTLGLQPFAGSEYLKLVEPGETYQDLDRELLDRADHRALYGWRIPDRERVTVPIEKGAGQFRGVGALVSMTRRQKITDALKRAHDRLVGPDATTQAQNVRRLLARDGNNPEQIRTDTGDIDRPLILIVSSMIGGAGAGLFLDVTSVARSLFGNSVVSLLLTPEAFESDDRIDALATANAWPLTSDIQYLAAAERGSGDDDVAQARFSKVGDYSATLTASTVFVMGSATAEGSRIEGAGSTERVAGEVLASTVLRRETYDKFINYAINNAFARPDELKFGESGVFRSVGFARLELGRTRFHRYSTDRLLGIAGAQLLSQTLPRRRLEAGALEQLRDVIARHAAERAPALATAANLTPNQILSAIRPTPFDQWSPDAAANQIGTGRKVTASRAAGNLMRWSDTQQQADEDRWRDVLAANVDRWVPAVERDVVAAAWSTAATDGLPVAIGALELTHARLLDAATQLRQEADARRSGGLRAQLDRTIGRLGKKEPSPELRSRLSRMAANDLTARFESQAKKVVADLCEEAASNLVSPLLSSFELMLEQLTSADSAWPTLLRSIPDLDEERIDSYRPRHHEQVLEPIEGPGGFAERFVELSMESVKIPRARDAMREAAKEALESLHQRGHIRIESTWQPRLGRALDRSAVHTFVTADLSVLALRRSAQRWLGREGQPFKPYFEAGLGAFAAEGAENVELLADRLQVLLRLGAPLGRINTTLVNRWHKQRNQRTVFSPLPFAAVPEARRALGQVLGPGDGVQWVVADRDDITMLSEEGPYQAACHESIMEPIRTLVDRFRPAAGSTNGAGYSELGRLRRAVPLSLSGPLNREGFKSLARGAVLGQAIGIVRLDEIGESGRTLPRAVYDDLEADAWLPLPELSYPQDPTMPRELVSSICGLVESLKYAYLEASGKGNIDRLRPFQVMLAIGTDRQADFIGRLDLAQRNRAERLIERIQVIVESRPPLNLKAETPKVSTDFDELGHLLLEAANELEAAMRGHVMDLTNEDGLRI